MADVNVRSSQQVRIVATPRDAQGGVAPIDGRVRIACVDPLTLGPDGLPVEVPFPPGWGPGPDQPSVTEAVLLPPTSGATPDDSPKLHVMLKGDADLTASETVIVTRVWSVSDVPEQAVILDGGVVLEARGT